MDHDQAGFPCAGEGSLTIYNLNVSSELVGEMNDLLLNDGSERAAYILCNKSEVSFEPWERVPVTTFIVDKIVPVPDEDVLQATPSHITWRTASFVKALKEAQAKDQIVGIVHSHPGGIDDFSAQDDVNEPGLVQLCVNRNGFGTMMLSLIVTGEGRLRGRVWLRPDEKSHEPIRVIQEVGERIKLHYPGRGKVLSAHAFSRQALAFGDSLNQDLKRLRVSIVGSGGTGSAVAMLLARLGVGQIALIDNDIVDRTNLNRLHGSSQMDADAMRPKVDVVANMVAGMGLGVRVFPLESWVGDAGCRDVLKASNVIFSCTDDHEGRILLNRFAYVYRVPVVDVGLAIEPSNEEGTPRLMALDGRVSVLGPGNTCLLCRGIVNPDVARAEGLRRSDPAEYELRKAEGYVLGEGNPSPAVVTFTTEVACMAVNELIHRMQGYKGEDGAASTRVRKFQLDIDRKPGHKPTEGCRVCRSDRYWGRGDMDQFLGVVS